MPIKIIPNSIGGLSIPGSLLNGPLANLYKKLNGIDILQYPRDLQSSARGHVVKFKINEVQPISISEEKEVSIQNIGAGVVSASKNLVTNILNKFQNNTVTGVTENGKDKNASATFNTALEPRKTQAAGYILLYMPDTVNFSYESNYGETSLLDVAKTGTELLAGTGSKVGSLAKNILSAVDSNVGKLALKTQGLAINPNQQLLFDGIPLRTYQMSFTFTPFSRQEAEEVDRIIKLFKTHSRPRTVTGSGGMLFVPPSTFNIEFEFNGQPNRYVSKVTESVITDIEVNYAPNGWSAHTDGSPVQTTMTLSFKELYVVDRKAVEEGY